MPDRIPRANEVATHFDDSPWWQITQEMSGPELRNRFNTEIQPALDRDKDGYLTHAELTAGKNAFGPGTRNAQAVQILHNYFSFMMDFRGNTTPRYFMAINYETINNYSEFDKSMLSFNSLVRSEVDSALANFDGIDFDKDKCLSLTELQIAKAMKINPGADLLYDNWWTIKSFAQCPGKGSGIGREALLDLLRRRTPPAHLQPGLTATPDVGADKSTRQTSTRNSLPKNMPLERPDPPLPKNMPLERPDPKVYRHRHYRSREGTPPVVVEPRSTPDGRVF